MSEINCYNYHCLWQVWHLYQIRQLSTTNRLDLFRCSQTWIKDWSGLKDLHYQFSFYILHCSPWYENLNLLVRIKFLKKNYVQNVVLNKNWKMYWSEQSFTGHGWRTIAYRKDCHCKNLKMMNPGLILEDVTVVVLDFWELLLRKWNIDGDTFFGVHDVLLGVTSTCWIADTPEIESRKSVIRCFVKWELIMKVLQPWSVFNSGLTASEKV
jgi:hypothetical protein